MDNLGKAVNHSNNIYRNSTIANDSLCRERYIHAVLKQQRELYFGLIRIHVLVHAAHEPIFGLAMMEELTHHGYRIGPGTLYPLLHGLERSGMLRSSVKTVAGRKRRVYTITSAGKKALARATEKVDELHQELHEKHLREIGF
ncbi:MAG: PadR family transcriptional regulator [Terracidiphilus sp.]|jgi:DNA-binding PadR family transcriptional regulator